MHLMLLCLLHSSLHSVFILSVILTSVLFVFFLLMCFYLFPHAFPRYCFFVLFILPYILTPFFRFSHSSLLLYLMCILTSFVCVFFTSLHSFHSAYSIFACILSPFLCAFFLFILTCILFTILYSLCFFYVPFFSLLPILSLFVHAFSPLQ